MKFRESIFDDPQVTALIEAHNDFCLSETSPCKAHRLSVDQLKSPDIRFWTAWEADIVVGCIALRDLGEGKGEVKSMHVIETHRGQGAADMLLAHLISEAKEAGINWLGLETGESPNFMRAIVFYQKHGFSRVGTFAQYTPENSGVLMAREIG